MSHSFYILRNSSCPNSIVCARLLTLVFSCVLSLLRCPIHCPFHSMSFVLPVWLQRIISTLFSCSDSLVKTWEEEAVLHIFLHEGIVLPWHVPVWDSHGMMTCIELLNFSWYLHKYLWHNLIAFNLEKKKTNSYLLLITVFVILVSVYC